MEEKFRIQMRVSSTHTNCITIALHLRSFDRHLYLDDSIFYRGRLVSSFLIDMRFLVLGLTLIVSLLVVRRISAHGRLIEPPSRASMWRYGFDTPHDYNDHECYCGGFTRQWQRNKGKCGICGDPWDSPTVSPKKKNAEC